MNEIENLLLLEVLLIGATYLAIKKHGIWSVSSFVLVLYSIVGFCSINFYLAPGFKYSIHAGNITTYAVVYFWSILMIFFYPLYTFNESYKSIIINIKIFNILYYTTFCCSSIVLLHTLIRNDISIENILLNFSDIRQETGYTSMEYHTLLDGIITGYLASMKYFGLTFAMFSFFVLKRKRLIDKLFLIVVLVAPIIQSLISAGRAEILFLLFSIIFNFLLLRPFLEVKTEKRFEITVLIVMIIIALYILYANMSRFGDTTEGESYFLWKYAGESFINFTGILFPDIKGYTDGMSSFGFFRRLIGLDYQNSLENLRHIVEVRTKTPSFIFYTFIGNLFRDFGPLITLIIAAIFSYVMVKKLKCHKALNFSQLLILSFLGQIFLPGIFYFSLYGQTGNIAIILLIFFYSKLQKKQNLLIINSRR